MKVLAGMLVSVVLLAGCVQLHEEAAKKAVSDMMKDPSSVQFRELSRGKTKSGLAFVCGEYNAKNSWGAYSGFQSFIWREGSYGAQLGSDEDHGYMINNLIEAQCTGKTVEFQAMIAKSDKYSPAYIDAVKIDLARFEAP